MGFVIWTDFNGLTILSDKLDPCSIEGRLKPNEFTPLLQEAVRRFEDQMKSE